MVTSSCCCGCDAARAPAVSALPPRAGAKDVRTMTSILITGIVSAAPARACKARDGSYLRYRFDKIAVEARRSSGSSSKVRNDLPQTPTLRSTRSSMNSSCSTLSDKLSDSSTAAVSLEQCGNKDATSCFTARCELPRWALSTRVTGASCAFRAQPPKPICRHHSRGRVEPPTCVQTSGLPRTGHGRPRPDYTATLPNYYT
jgi:hypothetical protein